MFFSLQRPASTINPLFLFLAVALIFNGHSASAGIIFSSTNFDIAVSDPVDVGATPLKAVVLTAIGKNGYMPNAFSAETVGTGITTTSTPRSLHQIYQYNTDDGIPYPTPTLQMNGLAAPLTAAQLALDTHFLVSNFIVPPGKTSPTENRTLNTLEDPNGGFGDKLYGTFSLVGAPSTSWDFARVVTYNLTTLNLNFSVSGVDGENHTSSATVLRSFQVPEPSVFILLGLGVLGLAVYRRRSKR